MQLYLLRSKLAGFKQPQCLLAFHFNVECVWIEEGPVKLLDVLNLSAYVQSLPSLMIFLRPFLLKKQIIIEYHVNKCKIHEEKGCFLLFLVGKNQIL